MAAAVSGLSPVIMTVRMPMTRICAKRSRMPPLTMSFRWITPSTRASSETTSGVPPVREMRIGDVGDALRKRAAEFDDVLLHRFRRAFADRAAFDS